MGASDERTAEGHMSAKAFREQGHRLVDFLADYLESSPERGGVEGYPVLSRVRPGEVLGKLPKSAPERGEEWGSILADAIGREGPIMPGITHWQHPGFFGFFPANTTFPAILGDLLSSGLGVQGMLWMTSPACTELETRVLDWVAEMLGLPGEFRSDGTGGGVIQGTASEAVLTAMVSARRRMLERRPELGADRLTYYTSTQAHSSVVKAAMIAGIARTPEDRSRLRLVEVDRLGAMRLDELERLMREDVRAGLVPCFVCGTIGTTATTAVDDLLGIAGVIEREAKGAGGWLHVDAAYSGAALICPEMRWMSRGLERADSFCFNPHKWMLTTFDCDCFYVRDRGELVRAMSITPSYLRNAASDSGEVIDYRDRQVPLGRRFRALKLWFVIRHYGQEGLRAYIRGHVRLAEKFEGWVRGNERFELASVRTAALVCFRLRGDGAWSAPESDRRNKLLAERLNATGKVYLTPTVLPETMCVGEDGRARGGTILRMAIGAVSTRERHVEEAWGLIREHAEAICSES